MPIWSAATINRFTEEAEDEISSSVKAVKERVALDIVAGTALYELPADCNDITRVTWKGKKLDPFSARDYHESDNITLSQSESFSYIFNQQGRNTIRLVPIPDISIADIGTDLWGSEIANRVIVEYNQRITVPTYMRRRLIKYFVLERCFLMEGDGQNLKCAKKHGERYQFYLNIFKKAYHETFVAKFNSLYPGSSVQVMGGGRLPSRFGQSAEF